MINAKKLYNTILNDSRITDLVKVVLDAYPETVETFPCVIYLDENQSDKSLRIIYRREILLRSRSIYLQRH